jgi:hypothetical protein
MPKRNHWSTNVSTHVFYRLSAGLSRSVEPFRGSALPCCHKVDLNRSSIFFSVRYAWSSNHTANGPYSETIQTNLGPVIAELTHTWHKLHTDTPLQDLKTSTGGPKIKPSLSPREIVLRGAASVTHTASLDHYKCQVPCMWWPKGWMRYGLLQCANSWLGCKDQSSFRWSWAIQAHWTIMGQQHLSLMSWPYEREPIRCKQPYAPDAIDRHSLERMNLTKE